MAANLVYTCDICGARKGTANHWHALSVLKHSMTLWKWNLLPPESALHLCSEKCVMVAISTRLGRDSFAAAQPEPLDDETKCAHCNGVDVVGKCTSCHEPTCIQCRNYRCERIVTAGAIR